jgi:hypothetical protein
MNLETPILDLSELTGRARRRSTLPPAARRDGRVVAGQGLYDSPR